MSEEWCEIEGAPNYLISNQGRVQNRSTGRILKPSYANRGYPRVTFKLNNKLTQIPIHRLVAKYFVDGEDVDRQVNHIDADKSNNNFKNLEWVTPRENVDHAVRMGRYRKRRNWVYNRETGSLEVFE